MRRQGDRKLSVWYAVSVGVFVRRGKGMPRIEERVVESTGKRIA